MPQNHKFRQNQENLKLLRGLQERHNLSVIYITHDLSTVSYFSERIFVMYAGRLVEKAPVNSLLQNPLHPYIGALLEETSDPDANNAESGQTTRGMSLPSALSTCDQRRLRCGHAARIRERQQLRQRQLLWIGGVLRQAQSSQFSDG